MAERWLVFCGGVAGAVGVALSAVAAHRGGETLQTAASFLLFHAPALLALAILADRHRPVGVAAVAIVAGLLLFSGDLVARHFTGGGLFPYSAPAGGMLLIGGWAGIALSVLVTWRR